MESGGITNKPLKSGHFFTYFLFKELSKKIKKFKDFLRNATYNAPHPTQTAMWRDYSI
jgi:hypothetical protein